MQPQYELKEYRKVVKNANKFILRKYFPNSAIELKSFTKSTSKIGRAGEGFLYDTL